MADNIDQEAAGLPDFLRDPIGIPRRRWRWMALGAVLGAAIGTALLVRWEPSYEAVATILVTSQQIPEEFVQHHRPRGSVLAAERHGESGAVAPEAQRADRRVQPLRRRSVSRAVRSRRVVSTMRYQIRISGQGGRAPVQGQMETAQRLHDLVRRARDPGGGSAKVANRLASLFVEAGIKARMERATEISRFLRQELSALGRGAARAEPPDRRVQRAVSRRAAERAAPATSRSWTGSACRSKSLELQIQDLQRAPLAQHSVQDPNSPIVRIGCSC